MIFLSNQLIILIIVHCSENIHVFAMVTVFSIAHLSINHSAAFVFSHMYCLGVKDDMVFNIELSFMIISSSGNVRVVKLHNKVAFR